MKYLPIIFLLIVISSCKESITNKNIEIIDSIMKNDNPQEAYNLLLELDSMTIINSKDQAYYSLLMTQAKYRNNIKFHNDSLINIALKYYKNTSEKEKYTRTLIYKGAVIQELGNKLEALEWYKKAENNADSTDYLNLGQINMRIAELYKESYILNRQDIERYKKSLFFYQKTPSLKYQLMCNSTIGALYRKTNFDSAHFYIMQAIKLSEKLADSTSYFYNLEILARTYMLQSSYLNAKNIVNKIIKHGSKYIDNFEVYNDACRIYANLGNIDSSRYYLNRIPTKNISDRQRIMLYSSLLNFERARGDLNKMLEYKYIVSRLSDSILISSLQYQLYIIDKQYDTTLITQKNAQMQITIKTTYIVFLLIIIGILIASVLIIIKRNKLKEKISIISQIQNESKNIIIHTQTKESKLKVIIHGQIEIIKQLVEYSYRYSGDANKFMKKFNELIKIGIPSDNIWKDIKYYLDINYNNIITKIETLYPNLNKDELNFIELICCNFSYIEISICMGYTNNRYIYKKKISIAKKMNLDITLDEFIENLKQN